MKANSRRSTATMAALVLLSISCSGGGEWEDREVLREIQSESSGKGGPGSPGTTSPEIGVALPLTGRLAVYGKAVRDGLNHAFDVNGEGRARLVVLDTGGSSGGASKAVKILADRARVLAVVGPCTSANALAAAEAAQARRVPLVLPTSTRFDLTKDREFVFRTCFADPLQGAAMAIYARRTLKIRTAGIVAVPSDTYSQSLSEAFEKAFTNMGGKITIKDVFGEGLGVEAPVKALSNASPPPEAVFIPAYAEEAARFMVQARSTGYGGVFLGGDGWHTPELIETGAEAVTGSHFTTHFISGDPGRIARRFVLSFLKATGRSPGAFEALGYDAGLAVLRALPTAQTKSRDGMREGLAGIEGLPGATGRINIDEAGNTVKNAVMATVKDGAFEFEKRIRFTPGIR